MLLARRIDSRRVAARIAAARRRRTLMALLGGGVLVGWSPASDWYPLWLVIVPVVAAVGFLWFARARCVRIMSRTPGGLAGWQPVGNSTPTPRIGWRRLRRSTARQNRCRPVVGWLRHPHVPP